MTKSKIFRQIAQFDVSSSQIPFLAPFRRRRRPQCLRSRPNASPDGNNRTAQRRFHQPADNPEWKSPLDAPPRLVRVGRKQNPWGLLILGAMPVTAFILGTWQVKRLSWKTELLAELEDRLARPPMPLPPRVNPDALAEFDHRRVTASGRFRHDKEMLIGPRIMDGQNGYYVVTPLERGHLKGLEEEEVLAQAEETESERAARRREGGTARRVTSTRTRETGSSGGENSSKATDGTRATTTVLVNRGWIPKAMGDQRARAPEALPTGEVEIEGMLREPWKKNMFTPDNKPETGEFLFPDVKQMAELTGSQPVWVEETMEPDLLVQYDREAKGIPVGRAAEVNVRNNHAQYVATWYALGIATSYMFYLLVRKPPADVARRVRQSRNW
ncbi:SURF1 family-domain-containing protein [Lineolata rhizophorae]|uniref:SURF1-like protein n=1 Tax=Lineolata rhizophorae TaxID=578093 RepID=A0A6A6P915_9PEZI|nr:SURF1 family-domain-containing protein [Lineolata rhizophorae]